VHRSIVMPFQNRWRSRICRWHWNREPIWGIADHRPDYGSTWELAAKAGDGPSIAGPQRHASGQLSEIKARTLTPAPICPLGHLSSTAPVLDSAVDEASTPDSNVIGGSSIVQPDEPLGTTTAPAASQVLHGTNAPMGATAARVYPAQPYGFNARSPWQSGVQAVNHDAEAANARSELEMIAVRWPRALPEQDRPRIPGTPRISSSRLRGLLSPPSTSKCGQEGGLT
jgi:hypothetical protein